MSNAIELIKEQQKKLRETDPAYMIGLQLIDMIREDTGIDSILTEDLSGKGMDLTACAAAMKKHADGIHTREKGSCVCIHPKEAEKVIRKFYGLPDPDEREAPKTVTSPEIMSLEDFL